ncbi:MAG: hypothetical protein E7252_04060 [Lachnospira sp.]|nr:hypothetical protein [Lachnospira sp.]
MLILFGFIIMIIILVVVAYPFISTIFMLGGMFKESKQRRQDLDEAIYHAKQIMNEQKKQEYTNVSTMWKCPHCNTTNNSSVAICKCGNSKHI